jgi:hypothetical protein
MFAPPGLPADAKPLPDPKQGCSAAAFDASSALLATRLDDSPGTVWIWDVNVGELRAVLTFHFPVSFQWHPHVRETLLLKCLEDGRRGVSYVWDPLSNGPTTIYAQSYLPGKESRGKINTAWVYGQTEPPKLLLSDSKHCVLVTLSDANQGAPNWHEADVTLASNAKSREGDVEDLDLSAAITDDTDMSAVDDTFSFKHV